MSEMHENQTRPFERLREEVASRDAGVRWRAAAALGELPGEEPEQALVRLMADPDYRVREKAVASLLRRFSPRVASACALALADDDNAGRRNAGLALLTRAGEAGRPVLLGALQHPSPDVRLAAALALPGPRADAPSVTAIEAAFRREADPNVRGALLQALGRSGRREAIPALLGILEEGSFWLKAHALEALGEIGDPDVAPRLLPLLDKPSLRRAALRSLARLSSSACAEELARRAVSEGPEGCDEELLAALRRSLEVSPAETVQRVRQVWTSAAETLVGRLEDREGPPGLRTDAAHLFAILDQPGAAGLLVRHGPYADGYAALSALPRTRLPEALAAILQEDSPEAALGLLERARERGELDQLTPLLSHRSPSVRATALSVLPPGRVSSGDLADELAVNDPETALPAAYSLVTEPADLSDADRRTRRAALLESARGADGPSRCAALMALAETDEPGVDDLMRAALQAEDPEVRTAAALASAHRDSMQEEDLLPRLVDQEPVVRGAVLRSLARWGARRGPAMRVSFRDLSPFLLGEPVEAAAAAAAIVSLAGAERSKVIEELMQQGPVVRRAALEQVAQTGDAAAAALAAPAAQHEDPETARAALMALLVAPANVAEPALASALSDPRPEVRQAAAETVARRGVPTSFSGELSRAVGAALASERDPEVLPMLFPAVAAAGGASAAEPLTMALASERAGAGADEAAVALARRFPEAVRSIWAAAPSRAERRWARAISRAATATGPVSIPARKEPDPR